MVILLVDGEAQKREERAAILRARGHEVVEAGGAQEAVTRSAGPASGIDILVTEVVLPGGSFGFDLYDALLSRFPELRVAYTTRYDLAGYDEALQGHQPLPVTAKDADFVRHVESAKRSISSSNKPILEPGTMLGHYQILQFLYSESETETYHALQYTVQRPVALVLLKPHLVKDEVAVERFLERQRAKAALTHPRVAPLYESGETGGYLYYTREMPPGQSLDVLAASGTLLTERTLAEVIYRAAHAISYALEKGYNYRPLSLRDVFVDAEMQSSIVNVFRPGDDAKRDHKADVQAFLLLLLPLTSHGKARGLLSDLAGRDLDWEGLSEALEEIRSDMSERSLIQRAEHENIALAPSSRMKWLLAVGGTACLLAVAFLGGLTGENLVEQDIIAPEMVLIPGGTDRLPFAIGKYEVTIGQYAEFLADISRRDASPYEHRSQPPTKKSHKPPQWDEAYAAAKSGGMFDNEPISLNHPVTRVDFWDAYAYAQWRGERLPTSDEWEYAARGPQRFLYPWGNDSRPTDANLGDDRKDVDGGALDGYNSTSPVNQPDTDSSPFGVVGMLGNVQEWTGTFERHPELPDLRVPVVRGGHYGVKSSPRLLTDRMFPDSPSDTALARGFRTASDGREK